MLLCYTIIIIFWRRKKEERWEAFIFYGSNNALFMYIEWKIKQKVEINEWLSFTYLDTNTHSQKSCSSVIYTSISLFFSLFDIAYAHVIPRPYSLDRIINWKSSGTSTIKVFASECIVQIRLKEKKKYTCVFYIVQGS